MPTAGDRLAPSDPPVSPISPSPSRPPLPDAGARARVDSWAWAVRLFRTRSLAAAACRAGHVKVNGERAKPATSVKVGDEVHVRGEGLERIVVVKKVITKRVGAALVPECIIDHSPPPPTKLDTPVAGARERGAGRPTKRERREIDALRGREHH